MSEQDIVPNGTSDDSVPQRKSRRIVLGALFVASYACLIYLPFLGSSRTLTRHEVMVTHPALRMLADGEWLVPHYSSGRWLDKPPLVSWLVIRSFAASATMASQRAAAAAFSSMEDCLVSLGV